jgi:glutamate-1-semialdehyde 2,1-aminomutase
MQLWLRFAEQAGKGITAMLPTADAAIVSAELAARFGLPLWQFTVSATDANRHVIRYSRMITGRLKDCCDRSLLSRLS